MASALNGHLQTKTQNFSVETVRNLLGLDNKGIAKLCAQVSLMPKKDTQGRTYFTKDDVEILRRIKNVNEHQAKTVKRSTQNLQQVQQPQQSQKAYATVPMKKTSVQNQLQAHSAAASAAAIDRICTSLSSMETSITGKISDIIDKKLEEKLDGMDEVVVELVRCKTENETLRYKMNELNKEVYNLKNELSKYKSVGLGLYLKKNGDSSLL